MVKKQKDVEVILYKNYRNGVKITVDKGKYKRRKIKTKEGVLWEEILSLRKERRSIPAVDIQYAQDFPDKTQVMLFQADNHTFWAMKQQDGKIFVEVPQTYDKEGNVKKTKSVVLFNSKKVKDGDVIKEVPKLLAERTYDGVEWLSDEVARSNSMFSTLGFFEKNPWIITVLMLVVIVVIVIFTYQEFGKMISTIASKVTPTTRYASELAYNASVMAYQTAWIQCQINPDCEVRDIPTDIPPH